MSYCLDTTGVGGCGCMEWGLGYMGWGWGGLGGGWGEGVVGRGCRELVRCIQLLGNILDK